MAKKYYVIDADGHVQSQVQWDRVLSPMYAKDGPKKVFLYGEQANWVIEGRIWPRASGKGHGVPPPFRDRVFGDSRGQQDPHARIPDMDLEGEQVAVLYGAFPEFTVPYLNNTGLATAMTTAYNDWLHEYCSAYPERLKGAAVVAPQDSRGAARELRRTVTELGFVAAVLPPHFRGKTLDHPDLWPLYSEAESLGVPITTHWGTSGNDDYAAGPGLFDNYFFIHAIGHPYQAGIAVASVVCNGVMDRFPKLKFAFLEAGCGWLPFWMGRFDEHFELIPQFVPIKRKPSEYMKGETFYISCEPDEPTLKFALDTVGDGRVLYASDYRHFDSIFPNAVKAIAERTELTEGEKRKVLGENAARCYGLSISASTPH